MKKLIGLIKNLLPKKTQQIAVSKVTPLFPSTQQNDHSHHNPTGACTGIVKWFDADRGYGFILPEYGEDIFVHYSGIVGKGFKSLQEGATVSFRLVQTPKGLHAQQVRLLTAHHAVAA